MMSHCRILFILPVLLGCMLVPVNAEGADPERQWSAYWLTGGTNAESGYHWLLISRQKLEKLAVSGEFTTPTPPQASPPILDASAVWIETHGKSAIWNSDGQPIKIPPLIRKNSSDDHKVHIGDVEYGVEPVPVDIAIQLLKNPNGKGFLHRRFPPLAGMENTAKALVALLEAETAAEKSPEHAAPIADCRLAGLCTHWR